MRKKRKKKDGSFIRDFKKDPEHIINTKYTINIIFTILLALVEITLLLYCKKFKFDWKYQCNILIVKYVVIILYFVLFSKIANISIAVDPCTGKEKFEPNILVKIYQSNFIILLFFVYMYYYLSNLYLEKIWQFGIITSIYLCLNIYSRDFFIEIIFKDKERIINNIYRLKKNIQTYNGRVLGILEGLFISAFILIREYTVIYGFLLFKSIASFRTNSNNHDGEKEHAEFYLMGTLSSYLISIGLTFLYIIVIKLQFNIYIVNILNKYLFQIVIP
ncbi:hypothetical protein [Anaeromicrobium sediminis]|uniref:Uncharacterized protein n=1 Tax=Anaeromicrobium sediminis TaxID=1478221 RepID=A0A267MQI6_9FIRM|nr:hypothetical protein [Anaeromicrobium sediminis]PAB60990.1 hypothetical protein CCE28_00730 [Anaeromicrobium sediminis]